MTQLQPSRSAPADADAAPSSSGAPVRGSRTVERLLLVVVVVLAAAALKLSRPVTLPLVAGIFVVMLAWPLQLRLERRLPRALSYALTFLAVLLVFAAFGGVLWWAASAVADHVPEVRPRIEALGRQASAWLERQGLPRPGGGDGGAALGAVAQVLGRTLYESLATFALTLGFVLLALVEVHDLRARAERLGARGREAVSLVDRIARVMRRYAAAKTATSAITGVASTLFALAVGLDLALVWGLIAFLFEYVPTIGSTLAVIPPALYAFVQFDGLARPLGIVAGYTLLQLFFGNFVDPKLEGRIIALSPVMVLLSITFWAWVWGAVGALLGVPLTMTIVVICRHFPRTRWVAELVATGDAANGDEQHGARHANGGADGAPAAPATPP